MGLANFRWRDSVRQTKSPVECAGVETRVVIFYPSRLVRYVIDWRVYPKHFSQFMKGRESTMAGHTDRKYISHKLSRVDNLVSLALKYGVPVGELKRENKLWNSDHLFLRENLLIPLTPENENALDENDSIVVYNGSSILKASPPSSSSPSHFPNGGPAVLEYTSTSGTGCPPETHPASSKKTSKTQSNGTCPTADVIENAEPRSDASDFFNKYDSSIARLKGDVAKLGKNAAAGKSMASEIRVSVSSMSSSRSSTSSYHLVNEDIEFVESETCC
ncbi:hypothetical protein Btru_022584 [Bulinus truncatus]|nr:hypothetical protein Btru_022584 [Bulinus truncatus]